MICKVFVSENYWMLVITAISVALKFIVVPFPSPEHHGSFDIQQHCSHNCEFKQLRDHWEEWVYHSSPGKPQENSNYNYNYRNSHKSKPWEGKSWSWVTTNFLTKTECEQRNRGNTSPYKGEKSVNENCLRKLRHWT